MANPKKLSTNIYLGIFLGIVLTVFLVYFFLPVGVTHTEPVFNDLCSSLTDYTMCGDITIRNVDTLHRTGTIVFTCFFETQRGTFTKEVGDSLSFGEEKKFHCVCPEVQLGEGVKVSYKLRAS